MSVKITGQVAGRTMPLYILQDGTHLTFHTAFLDEARKKMRTFFVPLNDWPSNIAKQLGIEYTFMRHATPEEAARVIADKGLNIKEISKV